MTEAYSCINVPPTALVWPGTTGADFARLIWPARGRDGVDEKRDGVADNPAALAPSAAAPVVLPIVCALVASRRCDRRMLGVSTDVMLFPKLAVLPVDRV